MSNALLIAGFGALATTVGFRLSGRPEATDRSDVWELAGGLLKTVGALIAIGGVGVAIHASARLDRPTPIVVTHTISLPEFGLQVLLPSTWKLESAEPGTDFVAAHSDTGAVLAGSVSVSSSPAPGLNAIIDRIIEEERARSGTVENVSRGVMALGLLDAQWVKLSFPRQGEVVRMRTVAVQRGLSTLLLTCTGAAAAQKACETAIHSVTMTR
jgi:hypothetical protein